MEMERAEVNDHSILAEMLNISFQVDEIIEDYKLSLPTLNVSTVDVYEEKIGKFKTEYGPIGTIKGFLTQYKYLRNKVALRAV